ncbi:MAG: histidinol-phosphate transaminase [Clostridiaceae bacterium]|nr:histidinol-phosphate transaminase [Clostridiaceae bacterium]
MSSRYLRKELGTLKPYIVDRAKYRIRLDANESFLRLEDYLINEMKDQISSALFNRYPDADSEAVCSLYAKYAGVSPENIMAGNGSDELIQVMVNTFIEKGEKVVVLSPDFSMYSFYTEIGGGIPVEIESDEEFDIDIDYLIKEVAKISPKMVILSNPNNPTGAVIKREDLIKLIESCNCLVVIDEAYFEFFRETLVDKISSYDNLIILRTCSKAAGMAAIRLGFLITNHQLLSELKSVKPPFNVNSISQSFGEVILKNENVIKLNSDKIVEQREILIQELRKFNDLKLFKTKANFVLIKFEKAEALNKRLLEEDIKVRSFGGGKLTNCMRITVGSEIENAGLLEVIKDFFQKGGKENE